MNSTVQTISDSELKKLVDESNDNVVIIDVRTPAEYAQEHIPGSINIPTSQLDNMHSQDWQDKKLVFYCRSGNRTKQAMPSMEPINAEEKLCLSGGIGQWKRCGFTTEINRKAPLDIMRQVQIVVAVMILLGVILAYLISPYFIILTIFAGLGLLVAGVTGFCGMANLLMLLPYNKPKNSNKE